MAVAYLAGTSPTELRDLLVSAQHARVTACPGLNIGEENGPFCAREQAADVPWETYATARLISEKDLSLLRRFDKRDASARASMMQEVRNTAYAGNASLVRLCRSRRRQPFTCRT
eukprot:352986-Chlamydomonas_euryale.AAC.13